MPGFVKIRVAVFDSALGTITPLNSTNRSLRAVAAPPCWAWYLLQTHSGWLG